MGVAVKKEEYNLYANNVSLFFKDIENTPMLEKEETKRLIKEYQNGNKSVLKKIMEGNVRLVIPIARRFSINAKTLQFLDLVSVGSLGIARAVETYDENKGDFSTYATDWIKHDIREEIAKYDLPIRKPVGVLNLEKEYSKLSDSSLSNEKIGEALGMSSEKLDEFKLKSRNVISLNTKLYDDNETELLETIAYNRNSIDDYLNIVVDRELLIVIKEILPPNLYYVLYQRVFANPKIPYEKIGQSLGVSYAAIQQQEQKAKKRIESILTDEYKRRRKYNIICEKYGKKIDLYSTEPMLVEDIIRFNYLKEKYPDEFSYVFYYKCLSRIRYSDDAIKRALNLSDDIYSNINECIISLLDENFMQSYSYKSFKNNLTKTRCKKIFDVKIRRNREIAYDEISCLLENCTYNELIEKYPSIARLRRKDTDLLKKILNGGLFEGVLTSRINKDVNLTIYGFKQTNTKTPMIDLYDTYLKRKNDFSKDQQDYLEYCYFHTKRDSKKEQDLREKYYECCSDLIYKLEVRHYNLDYFDDHTLNKEKYLFLKKKYSDVIDEKRIKIFDLLFGVDCEKYNLPNKEYTIKELADIFKEEYQKMHADVNIGIDYLINLYTNRSAKKHIDKKIYIPYLYDSDFKMLEDTRKYMKMYLEDDMTYEEISLKTGINRIKISNTILDTLKRIDCCRLLMPNFTASVDEIDSVFGSSISLEKEILVNIYINKKSIVDISEDYDISIKRINDIIKNFREKVLSIRLSNVVLDNTYISKVINAHESENILVEKERLIASLYYGIKNKLNPEGLKLNTREIKDVTGLDSKYISKALKNIENKLKQNKIGTYIKIGCYESRAKIAGVISDIHLPITEKEREIVCYFYGIKGHQTLSSEEIGKLFDEKPRRIQEKLKNAILKIKKYRAHEIEGIINFEVEIKPILRYFSDSDRIFIIDYYKNNMSYEEIGKKYGIPSHQIVPIFDRIIPQIYDLVNDIENAKKFDFDFYKDAIKDPRLPYDGDLELVTNLFDLYFGMSNMKSLPGTAIVEKLNLNLDSHEVTELITKLMISVLKLQNGIYKEKTFCYDDVKTFYLENKSKLRSDKIPAYKTYFENYEKKRSKGKIAKIPSVIVYDILRTKVKCLDIKNIDQKELEYILKEYGAKLNNYTFKHLTKLVGKDYTDYIRGKDLYHIYRIIHFCMMEEKKDNKILLFNF